MAESLSIVRQTGRWLKRERLQMLRQLSNEKSRYNTLLNQREIWHGMTRLKSFPRQVQVGTNWTCNLKCWFCRRETAEKDRIYSLTKDEQEISEEAMERLIQILPYAEVFTLTPLGEPLMYTGLERILERYQAAGCCNLQLTTNGNVTTEKKARMLVESGVRRIFLSIDSADPQTYEEMRVNGKLERVTQGLDYLNDWKARLDTEYPEIIIASTFLDKNIEHLAGLVEYAHANRIREISVQYMEAEIPEFEPQTLVHHIPKTIKALKEAQPLAKKLGVKLQIHLALRNMLSAHADDPAVAELLEDEPEIDTRGLTLIEKCTYPWTFLVVDTDGDCRPCCWTGMSFGNIAEKSFDEIWNGDLALKMRDNFLNNHIPPECRNKHCRVDM